MAVSAAVPSPRERLGWGFNALGAAVAGALSRELPGSMLLDDAPLPVACGLLAAACALAAVTPSRPAWWASLAAHLAASARLSLPLFLCLAWTGAGQELWAALAVYVALADAEHLAWRRPLVPTLVALALVTAWTATDRRVAPGRAVLVGLVCAAAASWGAERGRASPER